MYSKCKFNIYSIAITISLLSSCKYGEFKQNNKEDIFVINISENLKVNTKQFLLSDVAKDIEIIPLETNRHSIIRNVRDVIVGDNDLFVLDGMKHVLRFERKSGAFLNNISDFGNGPTDFLYCNGIGLDDNKQLIYLFTNPNVDNQIKSFNYQGKYINAFKCAETGSWMEGGHFAGSVRTYNYFNNKHVFRRMLPIQDGSKDIWQIGILDTSGNCVAKFSDISSVSYQTEVSKHDINSYIPYVWGAFSPIQNRYDKNVNYLFEANDTIYTYNEKNNSLDVRFILHCGERLDYESTHKMAKEQNYFSYIHATNCLETRDYLFVVAEKDNFSYLLKISKHDNSIQTIRNEGEVTLTPVMKIRFRNVSPPKFENDLSGGFSFFPFAQNDKQWIAIYEADELINSIDIVGLEKSNTIFPQKKEQLINIVKTLKEDDNPVVVIVTLK